MKLTNIKRIIQEDFPKDQQETIGKLAYIINNVFEQLEKILNKNVSIDNLNETVATIDVENNSSGNLKTSVLLRYDLTGKCQGLEVIDVDNLTNPSVYPTTAPFVIWDKNSAGLINILKVLGIPANYKFRLTLKVIGS